MPKFENKAAPSTSDLREVAPSQVERDTAGQQERVHKASTRDANAKETNLLKDHLAGAPTDERATPDPADKVARDTARYEALAREHGADLSEEGFNEALGKVARHKPSATK